ncbi:MAG: DUF86 domain-containing protein [Fibromonadaceae bacterium]|jgi:uncharacterized protein with HEPN domain|nr:DUF86 domain-containing protein [Fibromonadaceae bacterium]
MFDKALILEYLTKIEETVLHIQDRTQNINSVEDFLKTPNGVDMLDVAIIRLEAIGETIKKNDKKTEGLLLSKYTDIPWRKIMRMRDIIAHHYFDVDEEIIFDIVKNDLNQLLDTVCNMQSDSLLKESPHDPASINLS